MLPHQLEEYAPRFITCAGSFGYIAFVVMQGTLMYSRSKCINYIRLASL